MGETEGFYSLGERPFVGAVEREEGERGDGNGGMSIGYSIWQ